MSDVMFNIREVKAVNSDYSDLGYYHDLELDELIENQNEIKVQLDFNPEINVDDFTISIFVHCRYVYNHNDEPIEIFHFDILNTFDIENFYKVVSKNKKSINLDFLITLVSISVSNSRGFISAKVGFLNNQLVLPIMFPDNFVKDFKKDKIKKGRYFL